VVGRARSNASTVGRRAGVGTRPGSALLPRREPRATEQSRTCPGIVPTPWGSRRNFSHGPTPNWQFAVPPPLPVQLVTPLPSKRTYKPGKELDASAASWPITVAAQVIREAAPSYNRHQNGAGLVRSAGFSQSSTYGFGPPGSDGDADTARIRLLSLLRSPESSMLESSWRRELARGTCCFRTVDVYPRFLHAGQTLCPSRKPLMSG
jgi:hypothetical protein